jgi:hypothetical protein
MHELYQREKIDKEHTTIAYKRFLSKLEKQKQENAANSIMMMMPPQNNSFL